ncbi:MAG TPA: SIS domain-containing protein [Steroidobacteraceae bacterium]|jgi:D-sedoheptulose 7-phosphate isomerase|nr:SIS domain-containing protein [Steroidobacteraceae bacterium]
MSAQPADSPSHALAAFLRRETDEHREAFEALLPQLAGPFGEVLSLWERAVRGGGKLLFFGNGGSAADAQHLAAELVIRYQADRPAIAAIALNTDTSALTAGANDMGFERIFARQIEALGRPGDVAVGISTSGRSPNVLAALAVARARGLRTIALTGATARSAAGTAADAAAPELLALCDALLVVPSRTTARIQEMHIMLGHMLCKALEQRLGMMPA